MALRRALEARYNRCKSKSTSCFAYRPLRSRRNVYRNDQQIASTFGSRDNFNIPGTTATSIPQAAASGEFELRLPPLYDRTTALVPSLIERRSRPPEPGGHRRRDWPAFISHCHNFSGHDAEKRFS